MNIQEPMVQIWRFEFFFPRNMANWEGLFFKKILCTSRSALFLFRHQKKSRLVLSRYRLVLLFAFLRYFEDVAGYGW
jgi:hypothetical protein